MSKRRPYEVVGPTITPETINSLPEYSKDRVRNANEDLMRATLGLLVRPTIDFPNTGGNKLIHAIQSQVLVPNAERRARMRAEGKTFRHPITSFVLKHSLELTFFGKQPPTGIVEWMIEQGMDPRFALDLHTYRFTEGVDVRVAYARARAEGVLLHGIGTERKLGLSCVVVDDPYEDTVNAHRMNDEPIFTLRLDKPIGFNPEAQSIGFRGRQGGGPKMDASG